MFSLFLSIFSRFDQPQFQQPESLPPHPQEFSSQTGKQRSPPARANSMPPRASRPQVLKKFEISDSNNLETYSINGVNYTTYTTFRSPLTPDEIPDVNFVEKPPMIPEPDYEEPNNMINNTTNGQGSRTLERKKKKSVSFLEDISKKEETSVRRIGESEAVHDIVLRICKLTISRITHIFYESTFDLRKILD